MFEIGAFALILGALFAHLHMIPIGIGVLISPILLVRSRRGIIAIVFIISVGVLGMVRDRMETVVDKSIWGNRAFDANVVSVDRALDKTVVVVRDRTYNTNIKVSTKNLDTVLPGDVVTVRGTVKRPEDFVTDTGRIFPYEAYLRSKGIQAVMNNGVLVVTKKGSFSIVRFATKARHSIANIFSKYISFPVDGVFAGMIVGYQGGIPESIQDLFRNTGVLHVLVLSGYNITLLIGFVTILLARVPFRIRIVLTICTVIFLVLISGAGVASVRAGIMGSIALLAGMAIQSYSPLRALLVASLIFFCISPETIWNDPGFHLSFLATLFMVLLLPKAIKWFSWIPETKILNIRELLILAVCVPLFMLPYTMFFSGTVPLATIPANILLAIITPLIMVLGIVLILVSWIIPLAGIMGIIVSWMGSSVIYLLRIFSMLPTWNTPPVPWWSVVGTYVVLLYVLFRKDITAHVSEIERLLQQKPNSSG
jgi:competence protein ComEC